jgi:osmotically-inducible protein OsmY
MAHPHGRGVTTISARSGTTSLINHLRKCSLQLSPNATQMNKPGQLYALAFALTLTGALSGCAAYRKCGFAGCPDDARITADVQALFSQHPALEPPNLLRVQTLDHVVYLNGLVDTDLELQMAESVARQVTGVSKVVNSIGLSGGGR